MIYTLPILLEDGQKFTSIPTNSLSFPEVNGRDGAGIRVTHLVGFSDGDFLKKCPKCKQIKYSEEFGLRKTVSADQSNCKVCRSQY